MKLFGINIGKQPEEGKEGAEAESIKVSLNRYFGTISKHQAIIIILMVTAVLAMTTFQMLRFTNPPVDEARAQENIAKLKRIKIDDNVVEQIKALRDSNATTTTNVNQGRTNPFNE